MKTALRQCVRAHTHTHTHTHTRCERVSALSIHLWQLKTNVVVVISFSEMMNWSVLCHA